MAEDAPTADAPAPDAAATAEETAAAPTTVETGKEEEIDHMEALKRVMTKAASVDGLRRGLHECAKVLDNGTARLCCLAADCDNTEIVTLIKALCASSKIPLLEIETREKLGQWCGLFKLNEEGEVSKTVKTSVAAITDYGEGSRALEVLLAHLKKSKSE